MFPPPSERAAPHLPDGQAPRGPIDSTSPVEPVGPTRLLTLAEALQLPRLAIGGGPKVGKETLARRLTDRHLIHTDGFRDLHWEVQPQAIIEACQEHERFCVFGVQVGRALRKGLTVDVIIWLQWAQVDDRTERQRSMAKGCRTIFDDYLTKVGPAAPPVLYPTLEDLRA